MFDLKDYETAAQRIQRFRKEFTSGRIVVDVITHDFKEGIILVEAAVYRYAEDTLPAATDIALGIRDTYNPGMRKWYAEDTSTSAIARAIGLLLGTDERPTREDMGRVESVTPSQPQSASAPISKVSTVNSVADDAWLSETYTSVHGTQTAEPRELDASVLIAQELGGQVMETCKHGTRVLREGTSKAGKPYKGFMCVERSKENQCAPLWYILSPNGSFVRPKEAGDV